MAVTGSYTSELKWIGLSTDTKPSGQPIGTRFYETDTEKVYVYTGTDWSEV